MADPNPKRAKMDNPNGQSSSTSPKDRKIQPYLINLRTQCFNKVRSMPGFVDHTHFIRTFLLRDEIFGIFAPRRFGKSSHLNMVQEFLQIDVDKTTGEASSSVNGPAKGRKNYKVFEGTRIITDDNNKDLVEDHLGRHPVIHLDFKDANIISVEAAEMRCRLAMHDAFEDHSYLKTSKKLVPDDEEGNATAQDICKQWCNDVKYKKQDLNACLKNLTKYLYNHFNGAKVYILVDEIDSINARALLDVPKKKPDDNRMEKIQNICKVVGCLLGPVTKGCNLVAGMLLTGVSYVTGLGISGVVNNLIILNFLEDPMKFASNNNLVPFYGATREEVENLIRRLVKNKELVNLEGKKEFLNDTEELDTEKIMEFVQSRYNGYFDKKGNQVFSLWSVLQYLQNGVAINYWNQTNRINLYMILKCDKVLPEIIKLMRGDMIEFERHDTTTIQNLVNLYDLISAQNKDEVNPDVVFNFLMEQGYLTYREGGDQDGKFEKFKLPNAEIRAALSNMIGDIVKKGWKIATTSCSSLINAISLSLINDEKVLQSKMLGVYEQISSMLRQLEDINSAFVNETRISCIMYKALNDTKSFQLGVDLQIKDAESDPITSCRRPDFLMHKNDEKFSILWEVKHNKSTTDKYTTSLYALQEARGIVTTKNGNTKNYMDPVLKKLGREVLVIGLSVDSDIKVSLSYALGMEQKIFFKSERESTSFPDLYQEHNAVPLPLT